MWHLNGIVLASFVRPAVLITDAYNALNNQPYRRGEKENEFGETIKKTLAAGGNILLPVDTAGRVLELILTLEQYWSDKSLNYPIFFLTYVASSTIDYVKSFLEWVSDSIAKSFEQNHENPFLLKHVGFCISKSELDNAPDGPKVVLASMASLEVGFSHDIFVEWATDAKNLVLFTERGQGNDLCMNALWWVSNLSSINIFAQVASTFQGEQKFASDWNRFVGIRDLYHARLVK
nr:cleavage and polyadenylation specificity factor subunit 2-like [Quercus suber]